MSGFPISEEDKNKLANIIKERHEQKIEKTITHPADYKDIGEKYTTSTDSKNATTYYLPSDITVDYSENTKEEKEKLNIISAAYGFSKVFNKFKLFNSDMTLKEIKQSKNVHVTLIWTSAIRDSYSKYIPFRKLGIDNVVALKAPSTKTFEEHIKDLYKIIRELTEYSSSEIILYPTLNLIGGLYDGS